jgi:mono/diheme cytochrome c family protein
MRWTLSAAAMWLVTTVVVASSSSVAPASGNQHDALAEQRVAPPARLSETGLYAAGQSDAFAAGVRAFSPQYPLWTDGAAKSRWVYIPPGTVIDASAPYEWKLPIGVKFWKEFRFAGRKVETRLIWRASSTQWVFATYIWNAEETDALLAPAAGVRNVVDVAPGKRHSIPSTDDCAACHGTTRPGPLGFNALQLSPDRDPNAIHGEPLSEGMLTLDTLLNERRIEGGGRWRGRAPRIATDNPRTRAVLGYLSTNCGSCHNGRGEIAALAPVLRYEDLLRDADAVAASLVGQRTKWQINGRTEGSILVDLDIPDESALLARLKSRSPSSQMPPLGTVVRDADAVRQVSEWISRDLGVIARRSHR